MTTSPYFKEQKCRACNGTGDQETPDGYSLTDCQACEGTGQTATGILMQFGFDKTDLYIYDPYEPDEYGSNMYYGELRQANDWHLSEDNTDTDIYYVPGLMSGSDYSGSSVTVTNYKYIVENFGESDHVREVYGGHGTYAIAFNLSRIDNVELAQELVEIFESLENYPVICDDTLSEVEQEAEAEAWVNWIGRWNFPDALPDAINTYISTPGGAIYTPLQAVLEPSQIESVEGDDSFDGSLFALFLELMEKTSTYFENETGNNTYVRLEDICDARYILESEHWQALVKQGGVEFKERS